MRIHLVYRAGSSEPRRIDARMGHARRPRSLFQLVVTDRVVSRPSNPLRSSRSPPEQQAHSPHDECCDRPTRETTLLARQTATIDALSGDGSAWVWESGARE